MSSPLTREQYRELARRSCEAQGLTLEIKDPEQLRKIRRALRPSLARREEPRRAS